MLKSSTIDTILHVHNGEIFLANVSCKTCACKLLPCLYIVGYLNEKKIFNLN